MLIVWRWLHTNQQTEKFNNKLESLWNCSESEDVSWVDGPSYVATCLQNHLQMRFDCLDLGTNWGRIWVHSDLNLVLTTRDRITQDGWRGQRERDGRIRTHPWTIPPENPKCSEKDSCKSVRNILSHTVKDFSLIGALFWSSYHKSQSVLLFRFMCFLHLLHNILLCNILSKIKSVETCPSSAVPRSAGTCTGGYRSSSAAWWCSSVS